MPTDRLHAPDDEGELVTSMARILVVVTAVALLLLSTGCGKEAQDGIQTVAESPRRSATAACRLEYRTVETAVDAYTALYGKPPTSNDELLGVLAEAPTYVEIESDGTIGLTARAEELGCTLAAAKGD